MVPNVCGSSDRLDFDRSVTLIPGVLARVVESDRLSLRRLNTAHIAFIARHVPTIAMHSLLTGMMRPRSGDLVLVRVDSRGNGVPELMCGRGDGVGLREGMEAVVVYGRGWGDVHQLAMIPRSLERTQLIAKCGLVSTVAGSTASGHLPWVQPLGLVADATGKPLNLEDFCVNTAQDN